MSTRHFGSEPLNLPAYSQIFLLDAVGSTNEYAAALLSGQGDDVRTSLGFLSLVATGDQQQGKGRMNRVWSAPAGTSLSTSILVRPHVSEHGQMPVSAYHWATMLMSLAAVQTLEDLGVKDTSIKWPNDVLVGEKKICGILAQLVAEEPGIFSLVVGIGTNVTLESKDLPVETATSILLETGELYSLDTVLEKLATRFATLMTAFNRVQGDPTLPLDTQASLLDMVRSRMSTLGKEVNIHLPDGLIEEGRALDITDEGEILVQTANGPKSYAVGDIVHLRPCTQ